MNFKLLSINTLLKEEQEALIKKIEQRINRSYMREYLELHKVENRTKIYKNLRWMYPCGYWRLSDIDRRKIEDEKTKLAVKAQEELVSKIDYKDFLSFYCSKTSFDSVYWTLKQLDFPVNLTIAVSNQSIVLEEEQPDEPEVDGNEFIQFGSPSN